MELIRNVAHVVRDFYRTNTELVVFIFAMLLVGFVTLEVLALAPQPVAAQLECPTLLPVIEPDPAPSPMAFPAEWSWPIAEEETVDDSPVEPQVIRPVIIRDKTPEDAVEQETTSNTRRRYRRHHRRRW
jgi:hypothetical protein